MANPNDLNPLVNDYKTVCDVDRASFLLSRMLNFTEAIDLHIPKEERSGYDCISDYSELMRIINRRGYWIREDDTFTHYRCSECGARNLEFITQNYCCNCGAKMR